MLTYRALDHDGRLVSSFGTTETFTPGTATILASSHPVAGGKTGSFQVLSLGEGAIAPPSLAITIPGLHNRPSMEDWDSISLP